MISCILSAGGEQLGRSQTFSIERLQQKDYGGGSMTPNTSAPEASAAICAPMLGADFQLCEDLITGLHRIGDIPVGRAWPRSLGA